VWCNYDLEMGNNPFSVKVSIVIYAFNGQRVKGFFVLFSITFALRGVLKLTVIIM